MLDEQFGWQGRTIAHESLGSGPDVVLCHGTPWSSALWRPVAEALAVDHTVHLWDMPGYGRSSKHPDHAVDFGAQADAFSALLRHLDLERPHVVAHDFGGAVSLRSHLVNGSAYASLLLVDVVAIPPSGSPFFAFVHDHPDVLGDLPAYVHEAIVRTYVRGASHRGLHDADLDVLVAPWLGEEGQRAFYRQIAQYDEQFLVENERLLPSLAMPAGVVWGAEDSWIPLATGERLHGLLPAGSSLQVVAGAGHLIHLDAPVALMDAVRRWLTVPRSSGRGSAG